MESYVLIFYFTIFIVISSFLIISIDNTVFLLLILIIAFILASFTLYLLNCEFLALMFLIVYIGAIMILFLFLLMLLDLKFKNLSRSLNRDYLIGYLLVLLIIGLTVYQGNFVFYNCSIIELFNFTDWRLLVNSIYNINIYSMLLFGNFVVELLVIGLLLLLVLIGIILIINNYLSLDVKNSNSIKQVSIRSKFFY